MARQNINTAARQARADALAQLNSIGSSRTEFDTAEVFTALESDVAAFIERVQTNINNADIAVTGAIADLSMNVTDNGIGILGAEHIFYIDKGVKGSVLSEKAPNSPFAYSDKMPPQYVFVDYIKRKNINLKNEEFYAGDPSPYSDIDGDEKAINKAAWAMAKKVYKEGFKPQNIFSKEIPKLVEDATQTVASFSIDMITSSIRNQYGTDIFKKSFD